jgi:transmembrane sensor
MQGTHLTQKNQSVSDQATAWFVRLRADDVSVDEKAQFLKWCQEDGDHAKSYDKIRLLWERLDAPSKHVSVKLAAERLAVTSKFLPARQPYFRLLTTLPALVLAVLLAYRLPVHYQNSQSDYFTAPGKQMTVALQDGSRLTLNTDSALAVDFSDRQRHIELIRGEAFFQVSPDKNRPFTVSNGSASAQAVGTAFSVKKAGSDMQVTVSEGTVKVTSDNSDATALIHINERVEYLGGFVGPVMPADILETFAWQRGQLIFKRQPLAKVVEEVNRYRSGRIMIINPRLKERIVSGVFDTSDTDGVISAIKTTLKVNSLNLSDRLVLLY